MMVTKAQAKRQAAKDLSEFFDRYTAILYGAKEFVVKVASVARRSEEDPFVTTKQIAEHVAGHLPAAYLKTFGTDEPRKLKVWRILTLLSNASYLGAYEALGLKAVRGRGVTAIERTRGLRVIKGGRG